MDDAGPQVAADRGELREMMQQGIDQRSAIARVVGRSRAGMHHHACGLVDDGEVVVFVNDVERNFFRHGAQRLSVRWPGDRNLLIAFQSQRGFRGGIVHQHFAFRDELLHARAADF